MPKVSDVPHMGKAIVEAIERGAPDVDLDDLPKLQDMSADALTENVIAINSRNPDDRMKYLMEELVKSLHNYVKETSLTTEEWMATIQFLTQTGQMCTDIRQEFILLSDMLGVSALVDTINHPKPEGATESTVLGPFFVEDAQTIESGESISSEGKGDYMIVRGRVLDLKGNPVKNCLIETWETDQEGFYDTQYIEGQGYVQDCRGRLYTNDKGEYAFRCVVPVPYPIPNDGPVGKLLRKIGRHVFRPSHLHMMFQAEGYEELITSLYFEGDIFLSSDAVFGVKSSLVVDPKKIDDEAEAKKLGFMKAPFYAVDRDFVLLTTPEAKEYLDKTRTEREEQIAKAKTGKA